MKEIFQEYESNVRSYCRKFDTVFDKAKGSLLYDVQQKSYIDFFSGAGALNYGHNNDAIKQSLIDYIEQDHIMHGLDFYTKAKYDFLEKFTSVILKPRGLEYKIMFTGPTGTNAVEAALKLARKVTKRQNIIAFSGAFHGMSLGSLSLTTDKVSREGAGVSLDNVTFIPFESGCNYNFDSLDYLREVLLDDHSGIQKPAAVFLETIQAEGGVNVATSDWLKKLECLCKENEVLLVCDDIQVGCGRAGSFFSFEDAGIVPDLVVLSKSISGYGLPMSLLLIKPEYDIWKPAEHNGTFRGNQLAFVSATKALDFWMNPDFEKQIQEKSEIIEDFLINKILPLNNKLEIRGKGLIWAIDFSNTQGFNATQLVKVCFSNGLILETCGRGDTSVKLIPALTIDNTLLSNGLELLLNSIKCLILKLEL